jgi:hypothetical protein
MSITFLTVQESIFKKYIKYNRSNSNICIPQQDHRTKQYFTLPTLYISTNPHPDIQPVLSPPFFFLHSLFSPVLYLKHHREWWRGKKPNCNLHIHVLNLIHVSNCWTINPICLKIYKEWFLYMFLKWAIWIWWSNIRKSLPVLL